MRPPVPVVLFAHARPAHLARVLACLRENRIPLLLAYADGPKGEHDAPAVQAVREQLRAVDWCERHLVERPANLGLGRNILAGVTEVAAAADTFIVWEDDLICSPDTYRWMCAALRHYEADPRVRSVTAWTHPRVTPPDLADRPYFDGRAECWVWGTWARGWQGMRDETAREKMALAEARGIAPAAYGADLPRMARDEQARNLWAVRWLYHHLAHGGLCLRPPSSLVDHIGAGPAATNARFVDDWRNPRLAAAPSLSQAWPEPVEDPDCRRRWRAANPGGIRRLLRRLQAKVARFP